MRFFVVLFMAVALSLPARASDETSYASTYSSDQWDDFFGQMLFLRQEKKVSPESLALEILALLKHCQVSVAETLFQNRKSEFSADDREDFESLFLMAQNLQSPKAGQTLKNSTQSQRLNWPGKRKAKFKAGIKVRVENLCQDS